MEVFQRLRHALSGQGAHVDGPCVFEKVVDVRRGDGAAYEVFFQPPQTKGREYQ